MAGVQQDMEQIECNWARSQKDGRYVRDQRPTTGSSEGPDRMRGSPALVSTPGLLSCTFK